MNTQYAIIIIAALVVLVRVIAELVPLLAGGNKSLDHYDLEQAKKREQRRSGF